MFIAHTKRLADGSLSRHSLEDHLRATASLARTNAAAFGAEEWAELAGLWHDLGKYRPGFQRYVTQAGDPDAHIESAVRGRDKTHSAAGALWAERNLVATLGREGAVISRVLQYLIAGHHAGLDNWHGGLRERLAGADARAELEEALAAAPPIEIIECGRVRPPMEALRADKQADIPGRFALWVRMLFSCLVDADFLDTEAFMDDTRTAARAGALTIEAMLMRFDAHMDRIAAQAPPTPVNVVRADVLRQCRSKAALSPGVYTLTVPTGGGKTLSSLAFALRHALTHRKRRVIYAIPYTSIIEQTADIMRAIFGDENVVEHHSNVESEPEEETHRSRLACENWDAPLVVTTNVQLFESLFARRTSRCRKLHNLVGSVIVLDEAQLLPVEFLQPVLDVLRLLVRDYGVTLVLCTATQPALASQDSFDPHRSMRGFAPAEVTEVIDDVPALYAALKRVQVHLPANLNVASDWGDIAEQVERHTSVLAIVNRRADARDLYRILHARHPRGTRHLSALMCPQHRSDALTEIRRALRSRVEGDGNTSEPLRVVSTQLVEAGVDIDFPVVFRAMAGLDSIAQAAGRCNREGWLRRGEVYVFAPPKGSPPGLLRQGESACRQLLQDRPNDPLDLGLFARYFRRLYGDADIDKRGICNLLRDNQGEVRFRDAATAFRLIDDDDAATVLVRYRSITGDVEVDPLVGMLERDGPRRWLLRKLQRYGVSIYRHDLLRLLSVGDVREVKGCPGLYVQSSDLIYDPVTGVTLDGAPGDPARLIA